MHVHPPKLGARRKHPQRRRRHMRCGEIDVVTPQHVFNQAEREGLFVFVVERPGPLAQVADPLSRRHQQRSRAAGRIADAQPLNGVGVGPVAILFADRQCRQQHCRWRGGVERAIVTRGIEYAVEDAPQQIVAQAVDQPCDLADFPRERINSLRGIGRPRQRRERDAASLENGAVIDSEDTAPRFKKLAHSRSRLGGALRGVGRRPRTVVTSRSDRRQMLLQAVVKQHRGSDDQHAAFGRGEVAVAAFGARQVERFGERNPRRCRQPLHGGIEPVGKNLRNLVHILNTRWRGADRRRQLRYGARLPIVGAAAAGADLPGERIAGQRRLRSAFRVAQRDRDIA